MQINNGCFAITGAGRGIGRAIAEYVARHGARLALIEMNETLLAEAVEACRDLGAETRGYRTNVADEAQVVETFNAIRRDFDTLSGLINNAGILRDGLLVKARDGKVTEKLSLEQWQSVIDVNLTGTFICGREAAVAMVEQNRGGVIINISSVARTGNVGQGNYSASKAGVAALVVCWARELARYGIRVAGIAPGVFGTEMVLGIKPEALERLSRAIPLGRLGELGELADTAAYIIENDYVTGRVIEVDGGINL
jgi:3-oxoacyl-[acyl-carrier protein] reductase